ncbi:MAG: carboxymuconolactone decarboxylase family protein [Gammaproteobacteria bacterium]|nr:carboxymuconolactone decarboxylase family protein [Gammaproteobacteria bacterium]
MRLSKARVPALSREEWNEDAQSIMAKFGGSEPLNIFKTLCNHPELLRRWLVFANHILGKSTLPPREREILVLRIGWLCQAGYEWGQHVLIGRDCGLTDTEIQRIKAGPDADGWSSVDRALLEAVDELHADAHISDATWAKLAETWSTEQLMDVVFTVGQYNMVSMVLNSFGVQPDPGLPRLED